ncbi:hypothetical protein B0H14DRAFT_3512066 [Mycena olivaceomarginata]|nr:hypothetical protein B0H14DRAFT_3512066 [Mycena olivaceomarginata]
MATPQSAKADPCPAYRFAAHPSPPILSPLVVDTIVRDFGLEPKQLQLLRTFVGFGSLGSGL